MQYVGNLDVRVFLERKAKTVLSDLYLQVNKGKVG